METIAKPSKNGKKPLQALERAMESIAQPFVLWMDFAMLFIALSRVCNGFLSFFQWFCNGFHCSSHCFCNGFVAFSLVFRCFHSPFHGLQWFSLFSQWFYCGLLWFSMILQWFSLRFHRFPMVFLAFQLEAMKTSIRLTFLWGGEVPRNPPPHRKVTRVMVFNCFFNDFAMVSIAFIGFQWFSLLFN